MMLAVDSWPFVAAAWVAAAVVLAVYAWSLLRRGKRLSERVPPGSRRWM
jgi:hypothetical protein